MTCCPVSLHSNEYGSISWCAGCQRISLVFGTAFLSLTCGQFRSFGAMLNEDLNAYGQLSLPCGKTLSYQTDSRYVSIVLSYPELVQLASLVTYSSLMLEVYELLYES